MIHPSISIVSFILGSKLGIFCRNIRFFFTSHFVSFVKFGDFRNEGRKIGKRIAYITGLLLYNKMGLSTQIPKEISIASREKRIYISKGNIKAKAVKSYVEVTDKNFRLLEFLDALKAFKKIPDLDKSSAITILIAKLKVLSDKRLIELVKIALSYPPRVRAFLGAMLEKANKNIDTKKLENSLNPLSEYKLGITNEILSTVEKWNIK